MLCQKQFPMLLMDTLCCTTVLWVFHSYRGFRKPASVARSWPQSLFPFSHSFPPSPLYFGGYAFASEHLIMNEWSALSLSRSPKGLRWIFFCLRHTPTSPARHFLNASGRNVGRTILLHDPHKQYSSFLPAAQPALPCEADRSTSPQLSIYLSFYSESPKERLHHAPSCNSWKLGFAWMNPKILGIKSWIQIHLVQ